jgi:hypothetical protein
VVVATLFFNKINTSIRALKAKQVEEGLQVDEEEMMQNKFKLSFWPHCNQTDFCHSTLVD